MKLEVVVAADGTARCVVAARLPAGPDGRVFSLSQGALRSGGR